MASQSLKERGRSTDDQLQDLPADGHKRELKPDLRLGNEVLPGFKCRLAQLFPQAR
jgi:hypothetical protein